VNAYPFAIQMWMNGREWLARRMDQEHLAYRRCDNCFPWIADFARAQALMDQLHSTDWCRQFDRIARFLNPAHANSVKTYDKAGSILRTECTINNARAFRVYRQSERDPQGPKKTIPMSKGIVDLYARSQISQQVNDRYLEALAQLDTSERVEEVVSPICRRHTSKGKSIRALRPWSEPDQQLLAAVAQCGLAGDFRNRDIASRLYPNRPAKEVSAKVTYLLRLLREHKIIRRLPNTRKYRLTPKGAKIIATISLTQNATPEQLNKAAA